MSFFTINISTFDNNASHNSLCGGPITCGAKEERRIVTFNNFGFRVDYLNAKHAQRHFAQYASDKSQFRATGSGKRRQYNVNSTYDDMKSSTYCSYKRTFI